MTNASLRRGFAAACLASAALLTTACLSDSGGSSGGGGSRFELKGNGKVVAYNADSATLVLETNEYFCDSTELVEDSWEEDWRYQISGGRLKIWDDGDCYTEMNLSGNSSTIFGRWTASSYNGDVDLVPTAHRPPGCAPLDELPPDESELLFENVSLTLDIKADSSFTRNLQADLCFSRYLALVFSGDTTGYRQMGCNEVTLRDTAQGKTAEIRTTLNGYRLESTFSHGGTTCALKMINPFYTPGPDFSCAEVDEESNTSGFLSCVESTGYFEEEDEELLKRSVTSLEADLKKRIRALR